MKAYKKHTIHPFYKLLLSCLAVSSLLFFAVGCGGDDNSNGKQNNTGSKLQSAAGGKHYGGIFKYNESEYFRTLYPLNIGEVTGHRIGNNIYEGLVKLNPEDLSIVPGLAESWQVSDDAKTYTFTIRKGVHYHGSNEVFPDERGREVTVEDIKQSLDRLCSYDPNNKGYDFVKGRIVGAEAYYNATKNKKATSTGVQGVQIIDDNTLQIQLEQPFSSFLYILAMPFGYVFPQEALDKYGIDMRSKAVGTGPFYLKTVIENEAVVLLRNKHYWRKDAAGNQLPYLDGIKISFIGDDLSEMREFKQGNLDMKYRIPLELADEIITREGELIGEYQKYKFQRTPAMSVQYYGFLNTHPIFKNKKVRKAFNYAINRQRLVDYTMKGAGIPGNYFIVPPAFKNYDATSLKGYTFQPEKARQLLAEAGYPNGEGLDEVVLQINSGGGRNEQLAEAIQSQLKETLNVDVSISKLPFSQHLEATETMKVPFWRAGWVADYPDPENFLTLLWGGHLPSNPAEGRQYLNTFRYRNPEYDKYFEQALQTVDEGERNALFLKAEAIAIEDAPLMPLLYTEEQRLLQPYVRNFPQNPMEFRLFTEVYFEPTAQ